MWVIGLWIGNARPWARGRQRLMRRSLVGVGLDDDEVLGRQVVIVLGVGRGALQDRLDVPGGMLRHEPEERGGLLDRPAPDRRGDEVGLAGRPAEVLGSGGNAHGIASSYFSDVDRSVCLPCPRYVRVWANSPRRWPTMFSVT